MSPVKMERSAEKNADGLTVLSGKHKPREWMRGPATALIRVDKPNGYVNFNVLFAWLPKTRS